jgi:heme/copper-type cytochrome/quinol oxidase subunit 1
VRGSTILELEAGKIGREYLHGMLGMHRRWYDGGQYGVAGDHTVWGLTGFRWNQPILWAAWVIGLAQIPFIINFFRSIKHGKNANDNPPEATTVEWTAPSPLPARKFYAADHCISPTLRLQRSRGGAGFLSAERGCYCASPERNS